MVGRWNVTLLFNCHLFWGTYWFFRRGRKNRRDFDWCAFFFLMFWVLNFYGISIVFPFEADSKIFFAILFPSAATSFLNRSSFDVLVHSYVMFHSVLVLLCHLQPLGFDSKRLKWIMRHQPWRDWLARLIHQVQHPWWIWTKVTGELVVVPKTPQTRGTSTIFQLGDAPFTQEAHNLWLGWLRNLNVWSCRSIFVNVTPSHPGENLRKPRVHWKSGCWDANASSSNRDPILPPQWSWVRRWLQTATTPTVDLPKRKAPQSKIISPKTCQLQTSNRNTIF